MEQLGISHYIGDTLTGLPTPCFFDPHYPIRQNRPPVTLITGEPGAGKTMASMLFAAHSSISGKTTIIIDPKGDFFALRLLDKSGVLENVKIWSAFANPETGEVDKSNIGMLDPMTLTSNANVNASLTKGVIANLVDSLSDKQSAELIPILNDVSQSDAPSLLAVRNILMRNKDNDVRSLGQQLKLALGNPLAQLLTAPTKQKKEINFINSTTVMSLLGLSLPSTVRPTREYKIEERISVCIMNMLTHLILNTMKTTSKTIPKTLFIDEAWAVFGSESGASMIKDLALLGRSLNMATVLSTQKPSHIKMPEEKDDIDSTITTRFAFKSTSDADNTLNTQLMKLPSDWSTVFAELRSGSCVMNDCQGQHAIIKIELDEQWLEYFKTTPSAKKKEMI